MEKYPKVELCVDDIYFSQDSINCKFNSKTLQRHYLGDVLDGIIEETRPVVHLLKDMKVARRGNRWYSMNNRSLWILKQLRLQNRIYMVTVNRASGIEDWRFTTRNGGTCIQLRSDPGGIYTEQAVFWEYPGSGDDDPGSQATMLYECYDSDEEYDWEIQSTKELVCA